MRVFCDEGGKFYSGENPKSPTHSELNFPTENMLEVLGQEKEHISMEELILKVNHLPITRSQNV